MQWKFVFGIGQPGGYPRRRFLFLHFILEARYRAAAFRKGRRWEKRSDTKRSLARPKPGPKPERPTGWKPSCVKIGLLSFLFLRRPRPKRGVSFG